MAEAVAQEAPRCLDEYMEAIGQGRAAKEPPGYGCRARRSRDDVVGYLVDDRTGCRVLDRPLCFSDGKQLSTGYLILYTYCKQDGLDLLIAGQMPEALPATLKEPKAFDSLVAISHNFGAKDPQAAATQIEVCVAFRVPPYMAAQAELPGRDVWMINFKADDVTPLFVAAREGDLEMVKKQLEKLSSTGTVDPGDTVDEHGVSALSVAAGAGSEGICQALLENKANVNGADPIGGKSPLMFAATGGFENVVGLLLTAKSDPLAVDVEGSSALHWAALAGNTGAVRQLLPLSKKDHANKEGLTALQVAQKALEQGGSKDLEETVKVLSP